MNRYLATGGHCRASKQQTTSQWWWKRRGRSKTSNDSHPLPFSQEERGVWPRPLSLGIAMLLLNLAAMSRAADPDDLAGRLLGKAGTRTSSPAAVLPWIC
jgi:hypothetical protein